MVVMDDFEKFCTGIYDTIYEAVDKLVHAMAPDVDNPKKDYDYVKAEIMDELMYTAAEMLQSEGFATCIPRLIEVEESFDPVPCYLSDHRCEECKYVDKDGKTAMTLAEVTEQEDEEFDESALKLDENGNPILTIIGGGLSGRSDS